jgi:hypothetical protein
LPKSHVIGNNGCHFERLLFEVVLEAKSLDNPTIVLPDTDKKYCRAELVSAERRHYAT